MSDKTPRTIHRYDTKVSPSPAGTYLVAYLLDGRVVAIRERPTLKEAHRLVFEARKCERAA